MVSSPPNIPHGWSPAVDSLFGWSFLHYPSDRRIRFSDFARLGEPEPEWKGFDTKVDAEYLEAVYARLEAMQERWLPYPLEDE